MNVIEPILAMYSSYYYTIGFGGAYDPDFLCIDDQCSSNLGYSYALPSFLTYTSNEAKSFLGGSYKFQAVEIEVYWIDRNLLFSFFNSSLKAAMQCFYDYFLKS